MEQIPVLVDELGVARLQNAVYVGLMKFTLDQMNNEFDVDNPAPGKLGLQLTSYTAAYNVLNNAYALQMKRMETADIAALDSEGDQLIYGVKGMLEATLRMTYDQERMQKAQVFNEFVRKYRLDPTENMLAEWSKVQQMTEEWAGNAHLRMCGEALGLNGPMTRLQAIADEIRRLMTERNAATPEAQAMKQARAAMDDEYRALILILNSYAVVDSDTERFNVLIRALNKNIEYIRKHAMSGGASEDEGQEGGDTPTPTPKPDDQGGDDEGGEVTPVTPE